MTTSDGGKRALERAVRERCEAGELNVATTLAIESYGPEILGFILALLRDEDDAREVFATFCEDLWRGVSAFRWSCSLRTWAYTLARHAVARFQRDRTRRANRHVPLSHAPEISQVVMQVTASTPWYQKTEPRSRVARLRKSLSTDEHALLILRNDRELAWPDIARVLDRDAAVLRKRYQRLLGRLRELYRAAGES